MTFLPWNSFGGAQCMATIPYLYPAKCTIFAHVAAFGKLMGPACVLGRISDQSGGSMFIVSKKASEEINKILTQDDYKDKKLVLYFMGAG
jgi:hypothetical protein